MKGKVHSQAGPIGPFCNLLSLFQNEQSTPIGKKSPALRLQVKTVLSVALLRFQVILTFFLAQAIFCSISRRSSF